MVYFKENYNFPRLQGEVGESTYFQARGDPIANSYGIL